jgi:hypothetical protein
MDDVVKTSSETMAVMASTSFVLRRSLNMDAKLGV